MLFSINQVDVKYMVKCLMIVSDNPRAIWEEINAISEGFFVPVVKEEYGLNDAANKQLLVDFEAELSKLKDKLKTQLSDVVIDYKS